MKLELKDLKAESFNFYDFGRVESGASNTIRDLGEMAALTEQMTYIGFNLLSLDEITHACLVMIVDGSMDESMYSELGNCLASKMANPHDLLISPPYRIHRRTVMRMLESARQTFEHHYLHSFEEITVPVRMLIIPLTKEDNDV